MTTLIQMSWSLLNNQLSITKAQLLNLRVLSLLREGEQEKKEHVGQEENPHTVLLERVILDTVTIIRNNSLHFITLYMTITMDQTMNIPI